MVYSKVKNMMTNVSIYSRVRLKRLFGSISSSSLKSSKVERMKVIVEMTTMPSETKALIYDQSREIIFKEIAFSIKFLLVQFSKSTGIP